MGGTGEIARALAAASDHLRRHPEAGRVADRTATVVVTEGLRYRLSAPGCRPSGCGALVDWAERHSPVAAAARRPLPVSVELETG